MPGKEAHEHQKEAPQNEPFHGERAFDQKKEWNTQVLALIQDSMGDKYREDVMMAKILALINSGQDFGKFQEDKEDITTMRFSEGRILVFLNEDGEVVAKFDIGDGVKEAIEIRRDHNCEICERRRKRLTMYEFRYNSSWSDRWMRIMAAQNAKSPEEARRIKTDPNTPLPVDPKQQEARNTMRRLLADRKTKGEDILRAANKADDEEFDLTALVDPPLQHLDAREWESAWKFMDHSSEIDRLFSEKPDPRAGYAVNPFQSIEGNKHEWLRDVIQGASFLDRNDTLYFQDIAAAVYNDRFDEIQKQLKASGVPEVVIDRLHEKRSAISKVPILGPITGAFGNGSGDLQKTYKNLEKISAELAAVKDPAKVPEEYKDIYEHREKLKQVVQFLGDYIKYSVRLTNYVDQLKYRRGRDVARSERDPTMHERDRDASGAQSYTDRNKIIAAFERVFRTESPKEYTSELRHWVSWISDERPINFQDLNGHTVTLEKEWFTTYSSPETAYKLAYEAAQLQNRDEKTGNAYETVDMEAAVKHANTLLGLGISAFTVARPEGESVQSLIEDLSDAGVEVAPGKRLRFSGSFDADTHNLLAALKIKNIDDVYADDTDTEKAVNAVRQRLMRIGSVMYQKNFAARQEREAIERNDREIARVIVKLSDKEADAIIQKIRDAQKDGKRIDTARLTKLRETLVAGVVAVLPNRGGGVFFDYEFDDGFRIGFEAARVDNTNAVGVHIGQQFQVKEDFDITVHAGPGYVFSNETPGWTVGAGMTATQKFSAVDVSVQAGGGALLAEGGPFPAVGIGVGLDWAKRQEEYEKEFDAQKANSHLDELLKNPDPYTAVKENPNRYPELKDALYRIDNLEALDSASRRDMFREMLEIFHEEIQRQAVEESGKSFFEKFVPTGAGVGVALLTESGIPAPYAYLEFNPWSRKLVYRISSNVTQAEEGLEAKMTEELGKRYRGQIRMSKRILKTSREIMLDPESGRLMLMANEKEAKLNFRDIAQLHRFEQLRTELFDQAKIFVEPAGTENAEAGLLKLNIKEAHGNVEFFIDPAMRDDVVVVTDGFDMYLSVKKESELTLRRQDLTFPFEEGGATERTVITISNNPYLPREAIQEQAAWYATRTPTTSWVVRETSRGLTEEERSEKEVQQKNIKTLAQYNTWLETWPAVVHDRLEFEDHGEVQEAHSDLIKVLEKTSARETGHLKVRDVIKTKIQNLAGDAGWIQTFRKLSTVGFDYVRDNGEKITADWNIDFPRLTTEIRNKLGQDITGDELQAAILSFTIASFRNIHNGKPDEAQEKFADGLKNFERRMFTSILTKFYQDAGETKEKAEAKADVLVEAGIKMLEGTNMSEKGRGSEVGVLFGSLVGMDRITGIRRMVNYFEGENPEFGILGEHLLSVSSKEETERETAKFWISALSPYKAGFHTKPEPSSDNIAEYRAYHLDLLQNLHSPLAVKLLPLFAVTLSAEEMSSLKPLYNPDAPEQYVSALNREAVNKFLDFCDTVREAELAGKPKVIPLTAGHKDAPPRRGSDLLSRAPLGLAVVMDSRVSMGIYKECGNITGLVRENFALINTAERQIYYSEMAEGVIDTYAGYTRADFDVFAGALRPFRRAEVGEKQRKPKGREKPEPEEPTPAEAPTGAAPVVAEPTVEVPRGEHLDL